MLATPRKIHRFVTDLCQLIVPNSLPIKVKIDPDPIARTGECFFNVASRIKLHGGNEILGWQIFENPGLFIEAELHSVWQSTDGTLLDVTPPKRSSRETLFLQDPSASFDEQALKRRDNVRLAILNHQYVHEFLTFAAKFHEYEDNCTDPLTQGE